MEKSKDKLTILVVDDNPKNVEHIFNILNKDFNTLKANTFKSAVDILKKNPVSLMLLDLLMPSCFGVESILKIKGDPDTLHIPLIIMIPYDAIDLKVKAFKAGADDYIAKPIKEEELNLRIKNLLRFKEESDKVLTSYTQVFDLISYSQDLLSNFSPITFDFYKEVDRVIESFLNSLYFFKKPSSILLLFSDGVKIFYSKKENFIFKKASSLTVRDLNIFFKKEIQPSSIKIYISSEKKEEIEETLSFTLLSYNLKLSNYANFKTKDFSLFALNYDEEPTLFDAQSLRGIFYNVLFFRGLSYEVKEIKEAFINTINALARAAEASDDATGAHLKRVSEMSKLIAEKMQMPLNFIEDIFVSSRLHDVGKIHIPKEILLKERPLSKEEEHILRMHPEIGAKILGDYPSLLMAKNIALFHHEKYDGSGYPSGLKREEIPPEARIVSLVDVYDALRDKRPYKKNLTHKETYEILTKGDLKTSPSNFSPDVLEVFKTFHKTFEEIYNLYSLFEGL